LDFINNVFTVLNISQQENMYSNFLDFIELYSKNVLFLRREMDM